MAISCVFSPVDKDNKPYKALPEYKKTLGRKTGTRAFMKALSPTFQKRNESVLEIDSQGVATLQTALKTKDMRDFIGFEQTRKVLERQYGFTEVANTSDNFRMLVTEAKTFNDNNPDYIAYPVVSGDNIKNTIFKRNAASVEAFNSRYGSMVLNDKLLKIFEPLGIKVGDLLASEKAYSGIIDFSNAKSIAGEFVNLIRIANGMEGQLALSEEFAHLIVRMMKDQPLMQRIMNSLLQNRGMMQQILGKDYNLYVEKATDQSGNVNWDMIAEECVGRMLQGSMLDNVALQNESYFQKLWNRLKNFIINAFKGYNASEIEQAIIDADQTINTLAKNLLKGTLQFSKEDIEGVLSDTAREMADIKAKAIADGTFMKAPNGKPTNLTERQWLQVRTQNFINWFGDWINDPANASKVVDENGEPLVVYHGSRKADDIRVFHKAEYDKSFISEEKIKEAELIRDSIEWAENVINTFMQDPLVAFMIDEKPGAFVGESVYRFKMDAFKSMSQEQLDELKSRFGTKEFVNKYCTGDGMNSKEFLDLTDKDSGEYAESAFKISTFGQTLREAFRIIDTKNIDAVNADITLQEATIYKDNTISKLNGGIWFTPHPEYAEYITAQPKKIAVFLNIRNLQEPKEDLSSGVAGRYFALHPEVDGITGYDSGTRGDLSFAVRDSNQIKSATDNIGTFSTENPDILYHLKDELESIDKIITDAISVETKKTVILNNDKAVERAERKIKNLNAIIKASPEGKIKGIINYALAAVTDLGIARDALLKSASGERNFAMLRGVWSTILSYNEFIDQLGELINSEDEELKKLIDETQVKNKDEVLHTLKTAHRELANVRDLVKGRYKSVAFDSVEEFFKPFFNVKGKFIDSLGRERTLRQLIEEASGDIGFIDTYFMTMSSSGDLLLQLFDDVVQRAKGYARNDTIEDMHYIIRLMLKAQDAGITSFEWMFEHDSDGRKTGNYISSVNVGQFEKEKREFLKSLDEKYGENPRGEEARKKIKERKAWIDSHSVFFGSKPNASVYRNKEFNRLSAKQKEILMEFMQLKQKFDKRIPPSKVSTTRAIQMRRTSQQRLIDSVTNPEQAFKNVSESIAKEFTRASDDDSIYGERTGLRSFDGSEFKILPVLYTTRLSNPEELSTDVFSALAAYSYSTNVYKQMEKVVDPLEVAKNWTIENRNIRAVSNNKGMVEIVKGVVSPIYKKTNSNIVEKLDNFMDSQVYQRYYKDSDKTLNVMGREIKAGKLVNKWMSLSSTVQLGFNALAHLANAATGVGMQNIEALCGQYFTAKQLLTADKEYASSLVDYIPDIESKNPKSKLALFDQKFDIKKEFAGNIKNQMNTLFEKLFGKSVAFLGQTCGDHWLYNRTAIAMCLNKKVKLKDGTITNLWDALKVTDVFEGDSRIKELTIDAVDAETGETIDEDYIIRFSDKINRINHRLFGVYNSDDMVAAQRVAAGRAVLQYRQWIVPLFAKRFQKRNYILSLGEYEEGYYRTVLHLLAGLQGGMEGLKSTWKDLDEGQQRNIYRAIVEMSQFLAIWAIATFCSFGKDDPDRGWGMKLAEYMAQRELHELGNLTPSFTMGNEILKTVKSPASILNTTQAALNFSASVLDPRDWFDEIESGKYEGMSTLHKNFLKAPFPILAPFNQLDRVIDNIDETTRYYARNY